MGYESTRNNELQFSKEYLIGAINNLNELLGNWEARVEFVYVVLLVDWLRSGFSINELKRLFIFNIDDIIAWFENLPYHIQDANTWHDLGVTKFTQFKDRHRETKDFLSFKLHCEMALSVSKGRLCTSSNGISGTGL